METKKWGQKRLLWIAIPIIVVLVLGAFWFFHDRTPDPDKLYAAAVEDAVRAEEDEIEPLVELTKENPMTSWDSQGRILLLSWNQHPERYPEGESIQTSGEIWTFTDREIATWYAKNNDGIQDWELRLEQLIGLPPEAEYTHVTAFWVELADVVRPAYVTDVTEQMQLTFPSDTSPAFESWFEENTQYSYEESAYPWTRLGYTYDWANNGTEYGLTEFLIEKDATVQIAFTKTTEQFLLWLDEDAPLDDIT